ncbi:MAG: hypothetical protein V4805_17895 [Pseudomonadota bacterium]
MILATHYRRIVLVSGWYDLIVTIGFVTPWTFAAIFGVMQWAAQTWGLAGDLPAFGPMHVMMANMVGAVSVLWAVVRIRDPQTLFGRYDAVARLLIASLQIYAVMHGASTLILGFAVFEILFCILQSLPIQKGSEQGSERQLAQ